MNLPKILLFRRIVALAGIAAAALAGPPAQAGGIGLLTLCSFPSNQISTASLVQGTNGNFYGTTMGVGTNGKGAVFMVTPAGVFTNLVIFNRTNGSAPAAPLFLSTNGNFYGTTSTGGTSNFGTIFSMTHAGVLSTLANFYGTNGANPVSGLVRGSFGYYYGTTSAGGSNGLGTIFAWSPKIGISNLYAFSGSDGSNPQAGLVTNGDGNLYGTTFQKGANGLGTVFQLTPSNTLKTLVSFTGANGANPWGLVAAGSNLFGTTFSGGTSDFGAIFKVTTSGRLSLLASCDIANGSNPEAPLLLAADGFLYGTTVQGGDYGRGLAFRVSTNAGTVSNLYSFHGANGDYPKAALMQGNDLNLYGTTTSGGANGSGIMFELSGFVPTILQQPVSQNFTNKGTIHFVVQAAGPGPLSYQWEFDGTNLTVGSTFFDSTSSNLTVGPEWLTNAGSYSVIVSNSAGAVTSSVVTLTIPPPTLTIKSPKTNSTVTMATNTLTVQGTAADKYGVSNVQYQLLAGTNWTSATTANQWTNWSASVPLEAGTNIFLAYSVDPIGNHSTTQMVTVFYYTQSTLTLLTNGFGTISNSFKTNALVVGTNYTVKAVPNSRNLFSNWTGTITTTSNPLTFLMESNMTLTANFVTNSFIGAAGTYNGLFYDLTNGVGVKSSGMLKNLTVGTNGIYSGKLFIGGTNYSVSGTFDVSGNATNQIARASGLGSLLLGMNLNWSTNPPQVTGTVEGTNGIAWTASLLAERAGTNLPSAEYTLLIPPGRDTPTGDGYALITNHAGAATVTGALADGAALSQTIGESENLRLAVYATPYTNGGLLLGWLDMTNANGAPEGDLTWIRPASSSGPFTNSFTNVIQVQSKLWLNPPAKTPAIILTNGRLVISSAATNLTFNVAVSNNNTLVKLGASPTNSLKGSIDPKTGLLNVTFGNINGKGTMTGAGAVLQNLNTGGGYFVTKTNAGSISLLNGLSNFPPIILQQPASQNFFVSGAVSFAVGAAGSEPLGYQWKMDGTNLTDSWNLAGATNSQLTVGPEMVTNAGSYSVVVSNTNGAVTSSIVTLAFPPTIRAPTLTITAPKANSTVTNTNALTVLGTATGKYGVANVQYLLNSGANWISVTNTTQWTNWSAAVTLVGGSNIFKAYSVDPIGNHSTTQMVAVFYYTQSTLTLLTNGFGTISHSFKSNTLVVGANYTVKAVPNSRNLFSNWTGTITTTSNPLTFLMESNMTLTANFVTNSFIGAAGTYNGLFYDLTNGVGVKSSGMLKSLTVGTNGIYSGKLCIGGTSNSLSGAFDVSGYASNHIPRASGLGSLSLGMNLNWSTNPPQVTGTVEGTNGGAWTASLLAERAGANLPSAEYTLLIPPGPGAPAVSPGGDGYALITNHLGTATVTGALADGAAFSQSIAESETGLLALYATPYTNGGLLLGWLDVSGGAPAGTLTWIRPAAASGLFRYGYTNVVAVQSSAWSNPSSDTNAILLLNEQLDVSGAFLAAPLVFNVAIDYTNNDLAVFTGGATNSLSSSINPKSGLLKITFGNDNGKKTTDGTGAILQNHGLGGGYFITSTNAGAISLTPTVGP